MFFYFSVLHVGRLGSSVYLTVEHPACFKLCSWGIVLRFFCWKIIIIVWQQKWKIKPCDLFSRLLLFLSCVSFSSLWSALTPSLFLRFILLFEKRSPKDKGTFLHTYWLTLLFLTLEVCLLVSPVSQLLRSGWYFFSSQPWLLGHSILKGHPESSMDFIYPLVQLGHISGCIKQFLRCNIFSWGLYDSLENCERRGS